jgi:hypothetical protein
VTSADRRDGIATGALDPQPRIGCLAWSEGVGREASPYWPRFFDRNQAITALTATELLESWRDSSDPLVRVLREEMR